MEIQHKVASLLRAIDQLPDDAQTELLDAVVAMRCAHLGIYQSEDIDAALGTR